MKQILELALRAEDGFAAFSAMVEMLNMNPRLLRNVRDLAPQKKLARMAGVVQEYISRAEAGDFSRIGSYDLVRIVIAYATLNGDYDGRKRPVRGNAPVRDPGGKPDDVVRS